MQGDGGGREDEAEKMRFTPWSESCPVHPGLPSRPGAAHAPRAAGLAEECPHSCCSQTSFSDGPHARCIFVVALVSFGGAGEGLRVIQTTSPDSLGAGILRGL